MSRRAPRSSPSATARRRLFADQLDRAQGEEVAERAGDREVAASTACVRASRPVEAVIAGGIVRVSSGSTSAARAVMSGPLLSTRRSR